MVVWQPSCLEYLLFCKRLVGFLLGSLWFLQTYRYIFCTFLIPIWFVYICDYVINQQVVYRYVSVVSQRVLMFLWKLAQSPTLGRPSGWFFSQDQISRPCWLSWCKDFWNQISNSWVITVFLRFATFLVQLFLYKRMGRYWSVDKKALG